MIRRRAAVGLLALVAAAACARPPAHDPDAVRLVLYAEPSSLSLVGNTDNNSSQLAAVISDGLVAYDARGGYAPMIASAWETSPDARVLTFHLREGALWHDGRPVTSRDVAFTLAKVRDPATQARSWVSLFADVDAIETPDDRTVVVRYRRPYADALDAWRVPLVPEHVASLDADFLNGAFAHHPIGCGPYRFVSHEAGQHIVLEAFDRYWQGRPPVDRLVVRIVSSERTGFEALLIGDVDLMVVTPDLWREALASERARRLARDVYYRLLFWKVDWNQDGSNALFSDVRVRRAMVMALDRRRFAEAAAAGLARAPATTYAPETSWHDPSVAPLPYDPAEAGRLLDEAGWRRPAPGAVRERGGARLHFVMLLPAGAQELSDRIAAWMQDSLKSIGVEMTIEKVEWRAFQERRRAHAFEAAMAATQVDPTPDQFDLYASSARDGGFNYGGFRDDDVDRLLQEGRETLDPAARHAVYAKLQERLAALQPIGVLFQFAQPVLHDERLEGVAASSVGLLAFQPGPRAWRWVDAKTP